MTASTSATMCATTVGYTTMRDSTGRFRVSNAASDIFPNKADSIHAPAAFVDCHWARFSES